MRCSAAWSRSRVVTPGRVSSAISARISATMALARCMRATSAGDLISITDRSPAPHGSRRRSLPASRCPAPREAGLACESSRAEARSRRSKPAAAASPCRRRRRCGALARAGRGAARRFLASVTASEMTCSSGVRRIAEHPRQGLRLRHRARKAVEQKTASAVGLRRVARFIIASTSASGTSSPASM